MKSFNLLSEILFVQAQMSGPAPLSPFRFQSLERDSVCSSYYHPRAVTEILEFQSLEPDSVCSSKYRGGWHTRR